MELLPVIQQMRTLFLANTGHYPNRLKIGYLFVLAFRRELKFLLDTEFHNAVLLGIHIDVDYDRPELLEVEYVEKGNDDGEKSH